MYFNQVEAFVSVVKCKSFSQAAKNLYLSQPTISTHIKSLENELGVQLIIRTTKDIVLTEAGSTFYEYALELLHIREVALIKMQGFSKDVKGTLRIAASTVPAQYIIPEYITDFMKENPGIFFSLSQMDSGKVEENICHYNADIGITGSMGQDNRCIFEPFLCDRLQVITPNNEYFRSFHGNLPLEALKREKFIMREPGSGTRKESGNFFREKGIPIQSLNIVAELPSTESIKQAVCAGLGISIISERAAKDYKEFNYLLTFDFDTPSLNRNFYIVHHKGKKLSPAAECFIAFVRNRGK